MKKNILAFLFISINAIAFCQPICSFDEKMQELIITNPAYARDYLLTEQKIKEYIATHQVAKPGTPTVVYTIPVVVHVMHTGGAVGSIYNPSDAAIQNTINYLNQVYAGTYAGMEAPVGGAAVLNMELKFAFAQRTPACGFTNGIDRVDASSIPGYTAAGVNSSGSSGCADITLKNFARWNPADYYNIWVVNKIDANDGTTGQFVAGYAFFAGASASVDGTVMLATQMKVGSKVLPHEIGHAFNLYHPFQGSALNTSCPVNTTCTTDGDKVCDTDPITNNVNGSGVYDFACRTGNNTCTGTAHTKNTEHNFMSYTTCATLFTDGQKLRTQAAMSLASRASLVNSSGATPCGTVVNFTTATDTKTESNAGIVSGCRNYTDYTYQLTIGNLPSATAIATLTYSGTATKGLDYEVTTNGNFAVPDNTLTFTTSGATALPFTVRVFNDAGVEPAETAVVNFTLNNGGGNATTGTTSPTFTLTINSNDAAAIVPAVNTQSIGIAANNLGGALFNSSLQSKRVQMLYKATELTAVGFTAGPVTALSFFIGVKNSTRAFGNLTIKMGGTTISDLVNGTYNAIGGLTTVKNPFTYSTIAGYNDFTFDAPYTWNGTDNLVIELCYDNGTADATQTTDNTYGYSDCGGSCSTLGNMFWKDGINCSVAFGSVSLFFNNVKPIIKLTRTDIGTPISTVLGSTNTAYLGPNEDVYFYDATGNIMARIKNLTAFDYGCTTVSIDRAGTGTSQFWNNSLANNLLQKSIKIVPTNNTATGHYELTLYCTGTEVGNWQTATALAISTANLVKVSNGFFIPDVTPALPHINDATMVAVASQSFGTNYALTGDFNNTGFSGFGIGVPGNPLLTADFITKAGGNFTDGTIWQYNSAGATYTDALTAPGADNNSVVQTGHAVTLNANYACNTGKTLTINGSLFCGNNTVSGAGNVVLSAGSTLGIGSSGGISASGTTGNIQTTGRSFSTTANYTYNGTTNQVSGLGLPATINNLTIANTGLAANNIVSLSKTLTVNGNTTLTAGNLSIAANSLTINGAITYGTGLLIGAASSNLLIGGKAGNLNFDQSAADNYSLNSLTIKNTGTATLGSLLLSVKTVTLNPGANFTIPAGKKLITN
jgi:hypothetical protein